MHLNANADMPAIDRSIDRVFSLAAEKSRRLAQRWKDTEGSPVFTVKGRYTSRGWTEWTQGFQFGIPLLAGAETGDRDLLDYAERMIVEKMAIHLTHRGVHDHGFNNVSTYGMMLRLMTKSVIPEETWKRRFCELALRVSGAVQASRWTSLPEALGYIYSFNGPHSLFADTMRSLRSLALSWMLGQVLMEEQDSKVNLLGRLLAHAETTARYNIYHGNGRDRWDEKGRVAHESIFNIVNGSYRAPSSQQGYSPFTTWTRGLAWVMLGFAEELEFLAGLDEIDIASLGLPYFKSKDAAILRFQEVAREVCDFYLRNTPADGIPYWDTGGPQMHKIKDALEKNADPYNPFEPVDSSAAAIAAQALLRFGSFLGSEGKLYLNAGLSIVARLCSDEYLALGYEHEGLLLHAVYHYPNGWDYAPSKDLPPRGESCMWGDYHLLEAALWVREWRAGGKPSGFFDILRKADVT